MDSSFRVARFCPAAYHVTWVALELGPNPYEGLTPTPVTLTLEIFWTLES